MTSKRETFYAIQCKVHYVDHGDFKPVVKQSTKYIIMPEDEDSTSIRDSITGNLQDLRIRKFRYMEDAQEFGKDMVIAAAGVPLWAWWEIIQVSVYPNRRRKTGIFNLLSTPVDKELLGHD